MRSKARQWLALVVVVVVVVVALYNLFGGGSGITRMVSYSDLLKQIGAGRVSDAYIDGDELTAHDANGEQFGTTLPAQQQTAIDTLVQHGVRVTIVSEAENPILYVIVSWLPLAVFIGVLAYYLRRIAQSVQMSAAKLDALTVQIAQLKKSEG